MAQITTWGVKSIKFGALASDGGPSITLAVLGLTAEGTAELSIEDDTKTKFYAEEFDRAYFVGVKSGDATFKLSLTSMDVTGLQKVLGGTLSGTTPKKLSLPSSTFTFTNTIEITPTVGLVFTINCALCSGKLNYKPGRNDVMLVDLTCEILQPSKTGVDPISIADPA